MKTSASIFVACAVLVAIGCGGDATGSATVASMKARPQVPQGPHSEELVVKDLVVGTGAVAEVGDELSVHYVAGIYETGEEIESAWVDGEPLGFALGGGNWLDGWEEGMPGMRVGGRRRLIIPTSREDTPIGSELGDTLVYVVDLVGIREDAQ